MDWVGVAITVAVAFAVATTGVLLFDAVGDGWQEEFNEVCHEEYGPQWTLDNDSEVFRCEAPNGTTKQPIVAVAGMTTLGAIP